MGTMKATAPTNTPLMKVYVGGTGLFGIFRALAQAVEPAVQEFCTCRECFSYRKKLSIMTAIK